MGQKGLKLAFLGQKKLFLAIFFFGGIGGYPLHPLTENHSAQKSLAELGGKPPPPPSEKNPLSSF